jgi:hypothetical protein
MAVSNITIEVTILRYLVHKFVSGLVHMTMISIGQSKGSSIDDALDVAETIRISGWT